MMSTYLLFILTMALNMSGMEMGSDIRRIQPSNTDDENGLFIGRGMNGVVITLNSGYTRSDLRHYISHLDRSQGSIESFVPALGTGPFNSLLDVVGSEDPVNHGDAGVEADRSNPF